MRAGRPLSEPAKKYLCATRRWTRGVLDRELRPRGDARVDPDLPPLLRPGVERRARRLLRPLASRASGPGARIPRALQRQATCRSSSERVGVPPKPCLVSGYPRRALPGNSRCELHKLKSWSRRPARPDLDSAWGRLSLRRRKAFPICEVPGCSRPSASTDHIVPYCEGGTSDWGNLQALCREHHQEKTVAESHQAAKRKAAERRPLQR